MGTRLPWHSQKICELPGNAAVILEYLWGLICLSAKPDYHTCGIKFPVCHIINPWFNVETPGSISIYQWYPKEKQFYNCQIYDGMVQRTWNQLCKLWDVSHTSILYCDSVKIGIIFCQYRKKKKPETTCTVLWRKLFYYGQIIGDILLTTHLIFFSSLTYGSRTIRVVFNLIFLRIKGNENMCVTI